MASSVWPLNQAFTCSVPRACITIEEVREDRVQAVTWVEVTATGVGAAVFEVESGLGLWPEGSDVGLRADLAPCRLNLIHGMGISQ